MKRLTVICGVVLCFSAGSVGAQNCVPTVEQHVKVGDRLDLTLADSTHASGIVGMFNEEFQTLTLFRLNSSAANDYKYADIASIRYRSPRHLKPKWMLIGALGGTLIGVGVGSVAVDNNTSIFADLVPIVYGMFGGLVGLTAGTTVPLVFPGHTTVNCYR